MYYVPAACQKEQRTVQDKFTRVIFLILVDLLLCGSVPGFHSRRSGGIQMKVCTLHSNPTR